MRIVPARAGAPVLFSPASAVRPDQAGIKVHMIFVEEGLIERMDKGRNPERMSNA
jgi:hypothetical protein